MNRLFPAILFSLTLSACAAFPIANQPQSPSSTASSASGAAIDGDNVPSGTAGTGSITQRLLPSGFIEVGAADAPASLLLFTNVSCAYCREFQAEHFPRLMDDFVRSGKLRITIAPFALAKYRESERAALLQFCAAKQNKGVAMHDLLMMESIDSANYKAGLTTIGIDQAALQSCSDDAASMATITSQQSFARSLGVTLVPTYYVDGEQHVGLPYYPDLRGQIEEALTR